MIQIIPSASRFTFRNAWLEARWHFSFGHYFDQQNLGFGPLRVFNDDIIQPKNGFPTHPHDEMEIITYVTDGELTHSDSSGGTGVLRAGDVQRMTAGTGIRHSEFNKSPNPVRLLQLWIQPATPGLAPSYEQKPVATTPGKFAVVASGTPGNNAMLIRQDATIYVGKFADGQTAEHPLAPGRRAYVFVIDGAATLNGQQLNRGDQARVTEETKLTLSAPSSAHIMLIDLP